MKSPKDELIRELVEDPLSVAMMMTDGQLEHVIAEFVSVLNKRNHKRGGQN